NATKCFTMEELLSTVDVVTLHVDGRKENYNIIGEKEFALMKPGTIFLNLSRGHVVDIAALKKAIENKTIAGCGVDVFPVEPITNQDPFESEPRGLRNVIWTPQIGGSTKDAQESSAGFVPSNIIEHINTGSTPLSVTFPNRQLPTLATAPRLMHIHPNVPG